MTVQQHEPAVHRDPSAPIAHRVADLLARMTLAEKVAQLGSAWVFQVADADGFDVDRARTVMADGIGHITRISGASSLDAAAALAVANDIQRFLVERTRLGIPAIVHEEICSGVMAREATIFPQALGVAATFRPEHNVALAATVRDQMRAMGAHQGLSPVLDVSRDPRWGRTEETYGEDPFLVSAMGMAFVRGLQGDDLRTGVVATAKHFAGYASSEGGMNWAPVHVGERELRDVVMRPFEAAVRGAHAASVMNGYHELDGVPCGANRWLLSDVLRGEWGFDGTVVADYFSVAQLHDYHHVASSRAEAAAVGLTSGIDVELPGTDCYAGPLLDALVAGLVTEDVVDRAVARVLRTKFELGLFEQPYADPERLADHVRTPSQRELAGRIAADSLVLLSNDGTLPLAPGTRQVALIGPNADTARALLGDYSYVAHVESLLDLLRSGGNVFAIPIENEVDLDLDAWLATIPTVREALADRLPEAAVVHARGCAVRDDDRSGFDEAVELARASDVAIMVMGDRSGLTVDCTSGESRDVASLDLPGVQEDLVMAVAATGTPVVLVLLAGRPIGSPKVHEAAAAVLMAWFPGECGAAAIADVLTGAASPGGKLPISYPRSAGQIPLYHGHKVSGGRSHWKGEYVDLSNTPLHPFGHGLTYSTFAVTVTPLAGPTVSIGDVVEVSATVTNTGRVAADEVLQLYTRVPAASVTQPVRELQGIQRVTLAPGEIADVTFHVPVAALGFTGRDLHYVVEPGVVELWVGTSALAVRSAGHVVVDSSGLVGARRSFAHRTTVTVS